VVIERDLEGLSGSQEDLAFASLCFPARIITGAVLVKAKAWVLAKVSAAPMARLPASETASLED